MSRTSWQFSYEISPITLVNGIASQSSGGLLPISSLLQSIAANAGGADPENLDGYFAHFVTLPGSLLLSNQFSTYPFVNIATAANGIITSPLSVSLLMIAPAQTDSGYDNKTSIFSALQSSLALHTQLSGTYNVATPAYLYTDCLLQTLRDVTPGGDSKQPQTHWQWDFVQPLVTTQAAQQAQNSLMQRFTNGSKTTGDPPQWSSPAATVGEPLTGAAPSSNAAAQSTVAASASNLTK